MSQSDLRLLADRHDASTPRQSELVDSIDLQRVNRITSPVSVSDDGNQSDGMLRSHELDIEDDWSRDSWRCHLRSSIVSLSVNNCFIRDRSWSINEA